jgi:hypothetical protein
MATHNLKPAEWAKQAGLNSANAIYNFLQGRTQSLSLETLGRLAKVVPGTTVGQLTGEIISLTARETRTVTIRMAAEGGIWMRGAELEPGRQYEVAVPDVELPPSAYGIELRRGSLDAIYEPGSIGVCMPFGLFKETLRAGRKVVVQRVRADDMIEITVREIQADAGALWIVTRTAHRGLETAAIQVPNQYAGGLWLHNGDRVQILAVMLGIYTKL